ncbi:hypothetical protein ACJIZ3_008999 [Penstemon smallii]|uniref:Uncharacterized protein n=1 Tax=Penstemon smallii TaxID=265156 RepID=A0ABD3TCG7_9LAMI
MLFGEKPEGQELSSWQQNRMGDSIKHKVCTGLGAQRLSLFFYCKQCI